MKQDTSTKTDSLTTSVALCTYNGAKYLQYQLDSITSQISPPGEVVICDDASQDNTIDIINNWAKTVPFEVRVFQNEKNLGYTKNFEKCIELCKNEVIFLSDQDDIWYPEKIQTIVSVFSKDSQIGLVICDGDTIDEGNNPLPYYRKDIEEYYIDNSQPSYLSPYSSSLREASGCCFAFLSKFKSSLLPIPLPFSHDLWIYTLLPAAGKVKYIQNPLIHCRIHGKNVSVQYAHTISEHISYNKTLSKLTYQNRVAEYYRLAEQIIITEERIQSLPDNSYKSKAVKWLQHISRHYPNRGRIQRNMFIFFPLFLYELFFVQYFYHRQPLKNIAYDIYKGVTNSFSLRNFMNEINNITKWRKTNEKH